jgi:poly-gamma-glutamate synthesis protein (capsule biosynthesis protein)
MKIALLGDVALFGKFCSSENNDLEQYFKKIKSILAEHDFVVGNLETPFVDKLTPYGPKSAHIFSKPKNVETLKYLNINVVNLSNNHIYDFGNDAYELTKNILQDNNIKYFGVESRETQLVSGDVKVALHGYCSYNTNPLKVTFDSNKGVNGLDVEILTEKFKDNLSKGFFNIVSMHSGQEHVNYPSQDDMKMARSLATIAPYVYYGHHPHVVQGLESIEGAVIAYSLGNFCFSDVYTSKSKEPLIKMSENNKTGMILSLDITNEGIASHEVIPIYMGDKELAVGNEDVNLELEKFSEALSWNCDKYDGYRGVLISNYINSRKKLRNFSFYLKRLNFNSIKVILASKTNAKKYYKHVKSKL